MQEKKEVATKKKTTTPKKAAIKKEDIAQKEDSIKNEDAANKEENTINNEDIAKKEDTIKKEDSISKEDSDKKEDSIKKEDSANKEENATNNEDSTKKEEVPKKTHFSDERIKEIVQRLKKHVAEFRQLQEEGKKPYYKRIPITVMEIPYVMLVIDRKRGVASKLMKEIRIDRGKKPRQKISVTEFCNYTGIPISDVRDALNHLT